MNLVESRTQRVQLAIAALLPRGLHTLQPAMAPAQATTLLALPDELLELVFQRLHGWRDIFRCARLGRSLAFLCPQHERRVEQLNWCLDSWVGVRADWQAPAGGCWRSLWRWTGGAPSALRLRAPRPSPDWLRRHRHHVQTLKLGCIPGWGRFVCDPVPTRGSSCSSWPFLLSSLAGGPLRELCLAAEQGAAELGMFLGCLPHLEKLHVQCPALVFLPQLQQATALTWLSLAGTYDKEVVDYR